MNPSEYNFEGFFISDYHEKAHGQCSHFGYQVKDKSIFQQLRTIP